MATFCMMKRKHQAFVDELRRFSIGLDVDMIERIVAYSECLMSKDTNDLSAPVFFLEMAHQFNMTNQFMLNLVFGVFKTPQISAQNLTLQQYCKLICVFLTSDIDLKIDFVFTAYDINNDLELSRFEVIALLRPCIVGDDEEHDDMFNDLVALVMKVVDTNGNGSIDKEEFRSLVKNKNVLYMDVLGKCLPDDRDVLRFKNKLLSKTVLELKTFFTNENKRGIFGGNLSIGLSGEYYPIPLEY